MLFFRRKQSHFKQKQRIVQQKNRFNIKSNVYGQNTVILSRLTHLRDSTSIRQQKNFVTKRSVSLEEVKSFVVSLFNLSPSSSVALQLLTKYNKSFFNRYDIQVKEGEVKSGSNTRTLFTYRRADCHSRRTSFNQLSHDLMEHIKQNSLDGASPLPTQLLIQKFNNYKKLAFSLRFRKIGLPSVYKYKGNNLQAFTRTKRLRFYFKKYKKTRQNKKIIRLNGVHRYLPSYLQMDFRTLRAVKIQTPSEENIVYPFHMSLPKRYSFYRSRGFLFVSLT